jgi:hypothetical protein
VRHENAAFLPVSSALIAGRPSGREGTDVHIATRTGWMDRLTLLPVFEEWMNQKPDDRLWFVEEWIGYLYLDFLECCDGARPSVFPVSFLRAASRLVYSPPPALRFRACLPDTTSPRARQSHDCRLKPLGGAPGRFGIEREAWPRGRGC